MDNLKTVYSVLQECSRDLSGLFTQRDILLWVWERYPDVRESTLRAHVQALTSNATHRERNHPGLGSRPPLFDRVSHGVYRVHRDGGEVPHNSSGTVGPLSTQNSTNPRQPAARQPIDRQLVSNADVILVGCVKSKRATAAAAKDLYTSTLFTKERAYAERSTVPWYILSAKYGLIEPDEWLEPYEMYLPQTTRSYRHSWGAHVAQQLEGREGPLSQKLVEIHAGAAYVDALLPPLTSLGAIVTQPLEGLRMGERLAWYGTDPTSHAPSHFPATVDAGEIRQMLDVLQNDSVALSPTDFLATRGAGLKVPGLYSWWIDDEGADDLSRGLALRLAPGLIYAGLAGATHWPSGKRSTNTLWLRIQSMHLGRKARFSTFRLSLGSVLASKIGSDQIDEAGLSAWMHAHLRVVTAPYLDADVLGVVEAQVLQALDPPLNLNGMRDSVVRRRLSQLRKAVAT